MLAQSIERDRRQLEQGQGLVDRTPGEAGEFDQGLFGIYLLLRQQTLPGQGVIERRLRVALGIEQKARAIQLEIGVDRLDQALDFIFSSCLNCSFSIVPVDKNVVTRPPPIFTRERRNALTMCGDRSGAFLDDVVVVDLPSIE